MAKVQQAPLITPNEDFALLTCWLKPPEAEVHEGEPMCSLETSKAVLDIEAEYDGILVPLVSEGTKVKVGQPLAIFKDVANENIEELVKKLTQERVAIRGGEDSGTHEITSDRRWTKKAELLARKHGIDLSRIECSGVVKEEDVQALIGRQPQELGRDLVDALYPGNLQRRLLVLGAGQGAVLVINTALRSRHHRIVGILDDDASLKGNTVLAIPVIGPIKEVGRLWEEEIFDCLIISFGTDLEGRARVFEELSPLGIPFANVIDPSVSFDSNVTIGMGNVILAYCRIGACSIVGDNNFLSAYVNIEHHNVLGNHCTFGPGVMTSGSVRIGDRTKFGTGIFVEPGVQIGSDCSVASGVVLTTDVPSSSWVKSEITHRIRTKE